MQGLETVRGQRMSWNNHLQADDGPPSDTESAPHKSKRMLHPASNGVSDGSLLRSTGTLASVREGEVYAGLVQTIQSSSRHGESSSHSHGVPSSQVRAQPHPSARHTSSSSRQHGGSALPTQHAALPRQSPPHSPLVSTAFQPQPSAHSKGTQDNLRSGQSDTQDQTETHSSRHNTPERRYPYRPAEINTGRHHINDSPTPSGRLGSSSPEVDDYHSHQQNASSHHHHHRSHHSQNGPDSSSTLRRGPDASLLLRDGQTDVLSASSDMSDHHALVHLPNSITSSPERAVSSRGISKPLHASASGSGVPASGTASTATISSNARQPGASYPHPQLQKQKSQKQLLLPQPQESAHAQQQSQHHNSHREQPVVRSHPQLTHSGISVDDQSQTASEGSDSDVLLGEEELTELVNGPSDAATTPKSRRTSLLSHLSKDNNNTASTRRLSLVTPTPLSQTTPIAPNGSIASASLSHSKSHLTALSLNAGLSTQYFHRTLSSTMLPEHAGTSQNTNSPERSKLGRTFSSHDFLTPRNGMERSLAQVPEGKDNARADPQGSSLEATQAGQSTKTITNSPSTSTKSQQSDSITSHVHEATEPVANSTGLSAAARSDSAVAPVLTSTTPRAHPTSKPVPPSGGIAGGAPGAGRTSPSPSLLTRALSQQQLRAATALPALSLAEGDVAGNSNEGTVAPAHMTREEQKAAIEARRLKLQKEQEDAERKEAENAKIFEALAQEAKASVSSGYDKYTRSLSLTGRHSFCNADELYNLIMTPHDALLMSHIAKPLLRLVDCRSMAAYNQEHIRGAVCITEFTHQAGRNVLNTTPLIDQRAAALDPRNTIVFYGDDELAHLRDKESPDDRNHLHFGAPAADAPGAEKGRFTKQHAQIVQLMAAVDDGVSRLITLRGGLQGFKERFPFLICDLPHPQLCEADIQRGILNSINAIDTCLFQQRKALTTMSSCKCAKPHLSLRSPSPSYVPTPTAPPVLKARPQAQGLPKLQGDFNWQLQEVAMEEARRQNQKRRQATDALVRQSGMNKPDLLSPSQVKYDAASSEEGEEADADMRGSKTARESTPLASPVSPMSPVEQGGGKSGPGRSRRRKGGSQSQPQSPIDKSPAQPDGCLVCQTCQGLVIQWPLSPNPDEADPPLYGLVGPYPERTDARHLITACPFNIPRSEVPYLHRLQQMYLQLSNEQSDAANAVTPLVNGQVQNGHVVPGTSAMEFDPDLNVYPNLILSPWLYLGDQRCAWSLASLLDLQITHIVNISTDICNYFEDHPTARLTNNKPIKYLTIRMHDDQNSDIYSQFQLVFNFIDMAKQEDCNARIMVHCQMGISRSASLIIAYIMHLTRCSLKDVYYYTKIRRYIVQPNRGFWQQLALVERQIRSVPESTVYDIVESGARREAKAGCGAKCHCTIA